MVDKNLPVRYIAGAMEDHPLSLFAGHALSLGALAGYFAGNLPALATVAALIWYVLQIWESQTRARLWIKLRHSVHPQPTELMLAVAADKAVIKVDEAAKAAATKILETANIVAKQDASSK